jgi:predicted DNA-binding protein (MmcQ/YjbR family)
MQLKQLKDFCHGLPDAQQEELGRPSNLLAYKVGGKRFAYFKTSEPEQWRFSFKVTAERFLELTDQAGIKPARYMHRFHWVSVVNVKTIDEQYLKELVQWSYQKALASLSKKQQLAIKKLDDS